VFPLPVKLFSLSNVPDDEAEDVRALLRAGEIDFYETAAGNWGISAPALWLNDERRLAQARALIDAYEQERMLRAREEYAQRQRDGHKRTIVDMVRENPLRFIAYVAAIVAILYFSTRPFLDIGK
jgi:hypothetical protein